jgi:hypothetical protein
VAVGLVVLSASVADSYMYIAPCVSTAMARQQSQSPTPRPSPSPSSNLNDLSTLSRRLFPHKSCVCVCVRVRDSRIGILTEKTARALLIISNRPLGAPNALINLAVPVLCVPALQLSYCTHSLPVTAVTAVVVAGLTCVRDRERTTSWLSS